MKGAVCLGACGPNARVHRAQTSSTRLIDVQADPGPFHCHGCIHRNMFMLTNWWDKTLFQHFLLNMKQPVVLLMEDILQH